MKNFLINFLSKNFFRNIRNFLLIKPTFSLKPQNSKYTISDFFYWNQDNGFSTKFMLTNLSSQAYPDDNDIDYIKIIIFNNNGLKIKSISYELNPFQTIDLLFQDLNVSGYGSFCVFHKFNKLNDIILKNSFMAERGYVGYKTNLGVWNFMHGNKYACYLNDKNNIKSILSSSLYKFSYLPQVSFLDSKKTLIVLNNPTKKNIKYMIKFFYSNNIIIKSNTYNISEFGTLELSVEYKTAYVNIISNLLLSRPIIIKKYKTYFDIFHG